MKNGVEKTVECGKILIATRGNRKGRRKMKRQHKRWGGIPDKIIVSCFFMLLQFIFLVVLVYHLSHWAVWVNAVFQVISILLVISIVGKRGNPSHKMAWIIFILVFPVFSVPVYFIWNTSITVPAFKKRLRQQKRRSAAFLRRDTETEKRLRYADVFHWRQSVFLTKESGYPLYSNTEVEYLSPGEVFLPRLIEELRTARKYIFLEFYILAEGEMWDEIFSVLKQKVRDGVEVKIIFDDFGSAARQYKKFKKNLREAGISYSVFNPIRPSFDIFLNNRNHRKIVVIDGKTAFTGGLNIGDEYINKLERFGYWMDCGACFKGDAVRSFTVMFIEMWNAINSRKKSVNYEKYMVEIFPKCEGFVQPYSVSPLDHDRNPGGGLYMQMLNSAKDYVYIASPYLVLDSEMTAALCGAALSGIDVRIITPKKWDKWYVHPVTQYYYEQLLESGVKIYEFTPGFIHSKLFVSDDSVATVGTVNMDYRSFYYNFECGAWMCNVRAVGDIKRHMLRIMEDSDEITLSEWEKRPMSLKAKQFILHLFAPFM